MQRRFWTQPWHERNCMFSAFKLAVFLALFAPGLWTLGCYVMGHLGARPLTEITHQTGLWALRFLLISLAVTPLRRALYWPRLILVRRMLGLAAFAYGLAHFATYIVDQSFDLSMVTAEIAHRIYLSIGFSALLLLAILASTSTDAMIRRLGGRHWRRLHQLVYCIASLALVHYFMQSKLGIGEPLMMAALFGWSMAYRLIGWLAGAESAVRSWIVAALSLTAGLMTALGEAIYVHVYFHAGIARVLAASLAWNAGSRAAWSVFAVGLVIAAAGALRARHRVRTRSSRAGLLAATV